MSLLQQSVAWQTDTSAAQCARCTRQFGVFIRRHHCRVCGHVLCSSCTSVAKFTRRASGSVEQWRACRNCCETEAREVPQLSTLQPVPAWQHDGECTMCNSCGASFSFATRRHHCRQCGQLFCQDCSSKKALVRSLSFACPQRVCNGCFEKLTIPARKHTEAQVEDSGSNEQEAPKSSLFVEHRQPQPADSLPKTAAEEAHEEMIAPTAAAIDEPRIEDGAKIAAPSNTSSPAQLRARLTRFFSKHNQRKLKDIDQIISVFGEQEESLFQRLVKKYGPEPDDLLPVSDSQEDQQQRPSVGGEQVHDRSNDGGGDSSLQGIAKTTTEPLQLPAAVVPSPEIVQPTEPAAISSSNTAEVSEIALAQLDASDLVRIPTGTAQSFENGTVDGPELSVISVTLSVHHKRELPPETVRFVESGCWMLKPRSKKVDQGSIRTAFRMLGSSWNKRYVWCNSGVFCYGKERGKAEKEIALRLLRNTGRSSARVMMNADCPTEQAHFGWCIEFEGKEILFACYRELDRERFVAYIRFHEAKQEATWEHVSVDGVAPPLPMQSTPSLNGREEASKHQTSVGSAVSLTQPPEGNRSAITAENDARRLSATTIIEEAQPKIADRPAPLIDPFKKRRNVVVEETDMFE